MKCSIHDIQARNDRELAQAASEADAEYGSNRQKRAERRAELDRRLAGIDTAALWEAVEANRLAQQNARAVTSLFDNVQRAIGFK